MSSRAARWTVTGRVVLPIIVIGLLVAFGQYAHDNPRSILKGMFIDGAIVGVATMAIIQMIRYLVPVRAAFQRPLVEEWIDKYKLGSFLDALAEQEKVALFDLPVEQLFGQIGAAVDQSFAQAYTTKSDDRDADASLRNRVAAEEFTRRELDRLQIRITYEWRRRLRLAALVISGGLAIAWQFGSNGPSLANLLPILFVALVGGFMATVSRDLAAVIERLRR